MHTTDAHASETRFRLRPLLASISALVLFTVGLVAPLTPSRGCPGAGDLVGFVLVPVLLAAWGAAGSRGPVRGVLVVQALVTAAAALWLAARLGCLP